MFYAHAKINLHLHITGRAENGYHLLDSWVAFTDWSDAISITPSDKYELTITGEFSKNLGDDDNLITRAAHLLAAHFNIAPNVHITLDKSIPLGAGLGGGSADAACVLLALRDVWNLTASDDLLHSFASQLGSDISACLSKTPVIMRYTGNTLLPAPTSPTIYAILVNPNTPCPTPLVYKNYAASDAPFSSPVTFPEFTTSRDMCEFLKTHTRNDLTDAAIATNPDVARVLHALSNLNNAQLTRLSGSGSTCFALFETKDFANDAHDIIQKNNPDWWVRVTSIQEYK